MVASSELICLRSRIVSRWIELVSTLLLGALAQPLEMAPAGFLLDGPEPVLLEHELPRRLRVARHQQVEGEPRIGKHRGMEVGELAPSLPR